MSSQNTPPRSPADGPRPVSDSMPPSQIEMIITSRERDIGGFSVRRLLPYATHRMVGPFIFFDHMGPATFAPGHGMDVRPHPHIGLATVTYLFEGRIRHQDSLGSDQVIEPGAVNWMTAGHGIVHSERTPEPERGQGSRTNGIQLWVALPEEFEEMAPSFSHHPKSTLPEFKVGDARLKLLLGSAFGQKSPVPLCSDLFYAEVFLPPGAKLDIPAEGRELAAYVVKGRIRVDEPSRQHRGSSTTDQNDDREGAWAEAYSMVVAKTGENLSIENVAGDSSSNVAHDATDNGALTPPSEAHVMLLGGKPVGHRFIFWNLVSSSQSRIDQVKEEWRQGPRPGSTRFQPIPGDHSEFIPLPQEMP